MPQEKKLTVERRRELLEKELQGNTRLIDAVRKQIELYEGDIVKLRNKRYELEHELSAVETEKEKGGGKNAVQTKTERMGS